MLIMDSDNFLVIPLFFIAFPVIWCGILFLLAQLGGWTALAQVYQFTGSFQGERWSFQSGKVRWVGYNNVLTVGANQQGLYLKPFFLFQFGHAPLLIPWYDVSVEQKGGLFSYMEYRFQRAPSVRLKLGLPLSERLAQAAGDAWPKEDDWSG